MASVGSMRDQRKTSTRIAIGYKTPDNERLTGTADPPPLGLKKRPEEWVLVEYLLDHCGMVRSGSTDIWEVTNLVMACCDCTSQLL